MQPTLRTRLQLELLKKLREKKNPMQKGFTLVELMIVVAVIGLLSAVALPQFLGYRARAEASAKVSEAAGLAKECSTFVVAQVGSAPTYVTNANIATATCTTSGGTFTTSSFASTTVRCIGEDKTGTKVTVSVTGTGALTCATA